jgi:hypothetical protein
LIRRQGQVFLHEIDLRQPVASENFTEEPAVVAVHFGRQNLYLIDFGIGKSHKKISE